MDASTIRNGPIGTAPVHVTEPEICLDPIGVDRRAIHDRAAAFADAHLKTSEESNA